MPDKEQNELSIMAQVCEILDLVKDKAMLKRIVDWVHAKYGGSPVEEKKEEKSIIDMLKEAFPASPPSPYIYPNPFIYPPLPGVKPYDPYPYDPWKPSVPWIEPYYRWITTTTDAENPYKFTATNFEPNFTEKSDGHEGEHHPVCVSPGLSGWRG